MTYGSRHSHRHYRHEPTSSKAQRPSSVRIDKNIEENDDENIQTMSIDAENEILNQKQEDVTLGDSTDCSIM